MCSSDLGLEQTGSGGFRRSSARSLPDDCSAVLIGPGMQGDPPNAAFVAAVLERLRDAKVVLDAGAMDVVRTLPAHIAPSRFTAPERNTPSPSPLLLTPHAGELAHLSGSDKSWILDHPEAAVRDAAQQWNAFVVLKGAATLVGAPDGRLWKHEGGNIGLATSGSGDVLSGIITGLLARGATIEQASIWGVALHAHAGNRLAARVGMLGYLAREIAAEVPAIMQTLSCEAERPRSAVRRR